jgi:hypothetical protein
MVRSASSSSRGKKNYGRAKKSYGGGSGYTKLYVLAGVGVLLVGAVFGWLLFRPKDGETQAAACAVLVDRTGSSVSELTKASYVKQAAQMIDGCRNLRSSFAVYYFDNQNAKLQKASDEPFELWRPETHRKSLGEDKVDEAKKGALAAVRSVFETAPEASTGGHGSDIVTALSLASQSLQQQAAVEGVDDRYLVILTDGYQTGELGMKTAFTAPDSEVGPLLRRTEQLGLIPQLNGIAVSFGGVGGGVASDKSQVPAWYEALVKAGGGRMCVYNVEPTYLPGVC